MQGLGFNLINTYEKQEFWPYIRPDTGFQKRPDIGPAGYPVHPYESFTNYISQYH